MGSKEAEADEGHKKSEICQQLLGSQGPNLAELPSK